MTIQTTASKRKELVKAISEHLGQDANYNGPPSFTYSIGELTIHSDSSITSDDEAALEALKPFLIERGYLAAEAPTADDQESINPNTETEDSQDVSEQTINEEHESLEADAPLECSLMTEGEAVSKSDATEFATDLHENLEATLTQPEAVQADEDEPVADGTPATDEPPVSATSRIDSEGNALQIAVPMDGMNVQALINLVNMLHSKQYLLGRVTKVPTITIPEAVITELQENPPASVEEFLSITNDAVALGDMTGLDFKDDAIRVTYPLEQDAERCKAYSELTCAMVGAAKAATRVSPDEVIEENEKYYLRGWLVRLGFGGAAGKATRNALLRGLKGHTAFKTPADAERHKEKYAAIRRASRELPSEHLEAAEKAATDTNEEGSGENE